MLCRNVHRRGENNVRRLQARHLKVFGKHTDDSHRMIVKLDGLVQNIWVTVEAAHPKSIRNECNFWAVGQILFREEIASELRGDTEGGQKSLRNSRALQRYGISFSEIACVHTLFEGHGGEGLLVVAPFIKESAQCELLLLKRLHQANRDQPVIVRIGQAAEEDAVYHAEDRGCGADAECKRGDGCDRENRVAAKSAQRIAHVTQQILKPRKRPPFAVCLPRQLRATQSEQRLPTGLFGTEAGTDSILRVHCYVALKLSRKLVVLSPTESETAQPHPQCSEPVHHFPLCFMGRRQKARQDFGGLLPLGCSLAHAALAGFGELIEFRAAVVLRNSPARA